MRHGFEATCKHEGIEPLEACPCGGQTRGVAPGRRPLHVRESGRWTLRIASSWNSITSTGSRVVARRPSAIFDYGAAHTIAIAQNARG